MKRFISILAIALIFVSCAKRPLALKESAVASAGFTASRKLMAQAASPNEYALDSADSADGLQQDSSYERKLIKNGNISVEVQKLQEAAEQVSAWCTSFGGYIESSNSSQSNCSFTVKVPSAKFDEAMEAAGSFGTVKNKGVSVQDVSEQFYDLQTRLETRKVLRQKLQGYLKQASTMQDMLKIERELNSVQSEIESMEGRLNRLSNQIDFSTINVYMELPYNTTTGGFTFPDLGDGVRHFVANVISFFAGFISVIFYMIVCGIPLLAVAALVFWLLFGKIGLLVKLFNRLKK